MLLIPPLAPVVALRRGPAGARQYDLWIIFTKTITEGSRVEAGSQVQGWRWFHDETHPVGYDTVEDDIKPGRVVLSGIEGSFFNTFFMNRSPLFVSFCFKICCKLLLWWRENVAIQVFIVLSEKKTKTHQACSDNQGLPNELCNRREAAGLSLLFVLSLSHSTPNTLSNHFFFQMAVLEIQSNGDSSYVSQEAINSAIQSLEDPLQRVCGGGGASKN